MQELTEIEMGKGGRIFWERRELLVLHIWPKGDGSKQFVCERIETLEYSNKIIVLKNGTRTRN